MSNSGQIIDIFRAGRTDARRTDGNAQPLPPEPAAPRRPGLAVSEENWSRRSGRSPFRACRGHSGLWPAPIGWSGFTRPRQVFALRLGWPWQTALGDVACDQSVVAWLVAYSRPAERRRGLSHRPPRAAHCARHAA
jgi:hypothetical protein